MRVLSLSCFLVCVATGAAATEDWALTARGVGPLRVGMSLSEASQAIGRSLEIDESDPDSIACSEIDLPGDRNARVMFEDGRLTRITIAAGSYLRTDRKIGIGATEEEIAAVYKPLDIKPRDYVGLPAKDITWWSQHGRSGIRFQTNESGHVDTIHAGGPAIEYMEGCL